MCGRYTLSINELDFEDRFSKRLAFHFSPQFNVLPSNSMPIITAHEAMAFPAKWGLSSINKSKLIINARAETALSLPMFKNIILSSRCLIPADSFIEWDKSAIHQPYRITIKNSKTFAFAGIYNELFVNETKTRYYTIITTQANDQMKWLHNRMPLILNNHQENTWLDSDTKWRTILGQIPENELIFTPISSKINGSKENNRQLLTPIPPPLTLF